MSRIIRRVKSKENMPCRDIGATPSEGNPSTVVIAKSIIK